MRSSDELIDLRAERMFLLRQLDGSNNARRQMLNKRLTRVSKKIQKLCGVSVEGGKNQEI